MESEKDRFGEFMRLLERAKEDIYFAARDRELIEKLKRQLKKVEKAAGEVRELRCPKCNVALESYTFMKLPLDRCPSCGGVWFEKEEIEAIAGLVARSPLFSPVPWVP
jgi:rubrerythrin